MTDAWPLITDPYFYAVAVPAVILLGVSKSGFGAGFGSLAVPMMALAVVERPEPLRPSSATISPSPTCKSTP